MVGRLNLFLSIISIELSQSYFSEKIRAQQCKKNRIPSFCKGRIHFSTTFTYDNKGRLSTRTHPSGIVETNNYNSNGYLASISAGGATRFTVTAMNARQQTTAATYGSNLNATFGYTAYGYPSSVTTGNLQSYGYNFDPVTGNLNWRRNLEISTTENFTYDNLDRLTGVSGEYNLTMGYAANGNILTKSDVGTNTFEYNHPTKPYALTDLETASGLVPEDLQVATYNSFEQVSTIEEGDYYATFTYNSDDQRAKMLVTDLGSTILTRWYAGSRYVKEVKGSSTRHYTWIGGDAYTAPVLVYQYGTTTNWYDVLRDYLGNITHLVWTTNNVAAEYSFDAWGRRRDKDDWSYTLVGDAELIGDRGFTGHEWLPWFNLYNMNGRLYDPVVGRFLSPDNYVQMPDNTQNFNRYSYALNNPLKFTDPDGESLILLAAIIGGWMGMGQAMISSDKQGWGLVGDMAKGLFVGAAVGAAGAWTGGAVAGAIGTGGFLGGAASGFVGGFSGGFVGGAGGAWMNGADFGQGLSAGLNGGITSGLISGGIGGLVGGFSSMSKHGNFWDGDFITGPATAGLEGGGKVYGPFSIREVNVYGTARLGMGAVRNASWAYGMPQSFIKPYQSNGWENFRDNFGFVGRAGYNLIDQTWVTTQRMVFQKFPDQISHLNRSGLAGSDLVDAGINTMTNFAPMSKVAQGLRITKAPLNVSQFNKIYKGTGINSATNGGHFIRQYNYVVRNSNNFQGVWGGIGFGSFFISGY
jgi:RHS repeat-associated protein